MSNAANERRRPARVLIVDADAERAQEYYGMLRSTERIDAQWAAGKLAAFERIKSWQPQMLLIGDELNGQCGLEITVAIRKYSNIPVLVVTEDDSFEYFLRILSSGADGCLYHPIPAQLLEAQVLALLRRAYRYSKLVKVDVPQTGGPRRTTLPTAETLAAAMNTSLGSSSATHDFSTWPSCGSCGYAGPVEKFNAISATGDVSMRCPACGTGAGLRHTIG